MFVIFNVQNYLNKATELKWSILCSISHMTKLLAQYSVLYNVILNLTGNIYPEYKHHDLIILIYGLYLNWKI